MFSQLGDSLDKTFRNLRGVGKISEKNIKDAMREIRLSLLEADVEIGVAKQLIEAVQKKSLGIDVTKSITERVSMVAESADLQQLAKASIKQRVDNFDQFHDSVRYFTFTACEGACDLVDTSLCYSMSHLHIKRL